MKNNDSHGSVLVEVLVAALILLIVLTGVVHEISTLSITRIRLETRDRAVSYASSLHEKMKAAGCGLDVDAVEYDPTIDAVAEVADSFSGSNHNQFMGPWGRAQTCAFTSLQNALDSGNDQGEYFWVDGANTVRITESPSGERSSEGRVTFAAASAFCSRWGENFGATKRCNLGDQTYSTFVPISDADVTVQFDVSVSYWFEVTGRTNAKTTCGELTNSSFMYAPDVIVRKISISWRESSGDLQTMVMTKRDVVPVDSVEFATGTRVGFVSEQAAAAISLHPGGGSVADYPFYMQRNNNGGCIWLPFIRVRVDTAEAQPMIALSSDPEDIPSQTFGTREVIVGRTALTNQEIS